MKKRLFVLLLLLPSLCLGASARRRYMSGFRYASASEDYHFVYVSAGAGYTSMIENVDAAEMDGGFGGLVGVGYEFRNAGGFWLSVGGQVQMRKYTTRLSNYRFSPTWSGVDEMGTEAYFHYTINQRDEQTNATIGVPVMLGYYNGKTGLYFGVGGKLDLGLTTKVNTSGDFDLSATYDRYQGEWSDMPAYGYTNYLFSNSSHAKIRPFGSIIGEIGYDVLSTVPTRSRTDQLLKIGFYFEVGVSKMYGTAETGKEHVIVPEKGSGVDAATGVTINPFMPGGLTSSNTVMPYFVGVKITYMIGGARLGGGGTLHHGCSCYGN